MTIQTQNGEQTKLSIFLSALCQYLSAVNKVDLLEDSDLLENYFLSVDTEVTATFGTDKIATKLTATSPSQN